MSVCVVGSINVDLVAQVQPLPRPGETVMASALRRHPGGKGANQAIAAAKAGLARSEASVRMIGQVGRDEPGDWMLSVLTQAGVDIAAVTSDPDAPTGQAFITVSGDGENAIVVVPGANATLAIEPAAVLEGARVLLAQLETGLEPVERLFRPVPPDCLKILNAAPAMAGSERLFIHCDIVIVNETELAAYAGLTGPPKDEAAVIAAARALRCRSGQTVVVTLGAEGALAVGSEETVRTPGRPARVVDTVGAGDCFCGVLAAGLDEGLALEQAMQRANIAAALAVGRPGAADAMPDRTEIDLAVKAMM